MPSACAVCLVGIEGTGSYGAGLARHMAAAGVPVVGLSKKEIIRCLKRYVAREVYSHLRTGPG